MLAYSMVSQKSRLPTAFVLLEVFLGHSVQMCLHRDCGNDNNPGVAVRLWKISNTTHIYKVHCKKGITLKTMRQVALVEVHFISKCFKPILNLFCYTQCTAQSGTRSQKVQDRWQMHWCSAALRRMTSPTLQLTSPASSRNHTTLRACGRTI